jgi:(R,R)-butanediol dehydrogenase/meso-butanediol dehydrogenase/diacetyl reductase
MVETMRAAVLHGRRDMRVESVAVPIPRAGELLVKVSAVGICGTDAHEYWAGPTQFPVTYRHPVTGHQGALIPGHEPSGMVVAVGAGVAGFAEGDLVASGATTPCGACPACRQGRGTICAQISAVGVHRNGALAEYVVMPAVTCRLLAPYGVSADVGALAQPLAIAVHAIGRGRLTVGEHALLIGAGGIGAFATYVASRSGARVTVADRHPERLTVATSLGADTAIAVPADANTADVVADSVTEQVDVVYEMTGTAAGMAAALEAVVDGGRIVAVGFQHQARELDLFRLTLKELEIIGTNSLNLYPDLHTALQLLAARADGWSDVAPEVIPLSALVDDGLMPLVERRSHRIKTLIDPSIAKVRSIQDCATRRNQTTAGEL